MVLGEFSRTFWCIKMCKYEHNFFESGQFLRNQHRQGDLILNLNPDDAKLISNEIQEHQMKFTNIDRYSRTKFNSKTYKFQQKISYITPQNIYIYNIICIYDYKSMYTLYFMCTNEPFV